LPLELRTGSFDYPDDAATLIVQVPSLDQAEGDLTLSLEGPGVPGRRLLKLGGIDAGFFAAREQANRHYPIGIDLILIDQEGRIAGLPRTTQISIVTGANA
jgi:alpha-D-ribose 1-methylphosphonate 5-triphosphate synthase subunit PhnH